MGVIRITTALAGTMVGNLLTAMDAGSGAAYMNIYTVGSGIPAGPAISITDQTLLGTLVFDDPAGTVTNNVLTLAIATNEDAALDDGTISFVRVFDSDATAVFDGNAGLEGSAAPFQFRSLTCIKDLPIEFISGTITVPTGS